MALVLKNRVKSTTTTTGTGTITLGTAAAGYQSFSVIGDGNETYYVIKGTTEWEVGKGTYTSSGTTLSRQLVFGSSNNGALVDFAAGTKDVLCAYPAAAMPLGVPYCDDSEIGTDLSGWTAFQAALNNGIAGGTTFGNNNTNGIVSTIATPGGIWSGGVLSPDGNIYFIPGSSNLSGTSAVKINYLSGATAAYTLIIQNANFFSGGVLASNGDIHFVPAASSRGQKVNASGVVSTYSLVYTLGSNTTYRGGVLAPNGDVHFVPGDARVGQKVSTAGVVSTYSLVYTDSNGAYWGGVLAPNGDIHFVPHAARVGQKISAAGVVSTYSLVYTTSESYRGGVIGVNGDIHFIPNLAPVGQKISTAGVVSTYSLVYSQTAFPAFSGGVLAPNGDIHFIPSRGSASFPVRGQKVSATGVVSTYTVVYTTLLNDTLFSGGVLAPNGEIFMIPTQPTGCIQKISTNSGQPLGLGVCLSSFLNKS
jgi:hypothetical protein